MAIRRYLSFPGVAEEVVKQIGKYLLATFPDDRGLNFVVEEQYSLPLSSAEELSRLIGSLKRKAEEAQSHEMSKAVGWLKGEISKLRRSKSAKEARDILEDIILPYIAHNHVTWADLDASEQELLSVIEEMDNQRIAPWLVSVRNKGDSATDSWSDENAKMFELIKKATRSGRSGLKRFGITRLEYKRFAELNRKHWKAVEEGVADYWNH